jgi:hypothetical protein
MMLKREVKVHDCGVEWMLMMPMSMANTWLKFGKM